MAIKPKLSILLPAMFGYERTRPALESWLAQSSLNQLEVLLLLPTQFSLSQDEASQLPPICKVVSTGNADLHEARAIGIQVAAGEYIVMAEDHCFPDAGWTEAVLQRLEQGWDAIGSAMRPGNREDCWSEASFLVGYGEWMIPLSGGPTNVLCGWNGTVRTALLRQFGDSLGSEMLIGAFMMKKLQEQGSRFYIEKNAEMRHFDPPGCALNSKLLFIVGLGFGALRTESWAWPLRILYAFALPLIATLHFKRAWVSYVRAGKGCRLRRSVIFASFVLAFAWAIGEVVGAVSGRRRVSPHLWKTEVKPVSQEWIDRSDAEEKRLGNIT